jgi:hypothetical protein
VHYSFVELVIRSEIATNYIEHRPAGDGGEMLHFVNDRLYYTVDIKVRVYSHVVLGVRPKPTVSLVPPVFRF